MLDFVDYRGDAKAFAKRFRISNEAAEIYTQSEVIDLHIDSFIWQRLFGYRIEQRHTRGVLDARFFGQVDLPRLLEAGITGTTWVITTNPLRDSAEREEAFFENLRELSAKFEAHAAHFSVVRTASEFKAARASGRHAVFFGVQGGNALDHDVRAIERIPYGLLLRVTLVHLTPSHIGATSTAHPFPTPEGLGVKGADFIQALDAAKIFLDLAHIHPTAFWKALQVHNKEHPVLVTHTGVSGVYPHWRNLDDAQLRAIADTGGVVGIMYHAPYLGRPVSSVNVKTVADHIEHAVNVAGEDHVALGSDWDGAIITPKDFRTCLELPLLIDELLMRGHTPERLQKILGANFLRTLAQLRG
ncbi:MAG: membrane dipeptidase [Polyangiaceae bacterium]|nr:membrane dipeptidase [Polyangiaceae bacterium]